MGMGRLVLQRRLSSLEVEFRGLGDSFRGSSTSPGQARLDASCQLRHYVSGLSAPRREAECQHRACIPVGVCTSVN